MTAKRKVHQRTNNAKLMSFKVLPDIFQLNIQYTQTRQNH